MLAGLRLTGSFHQPESEPRSTAAPEIALSGFISSNHHHHQQQYNEYYYHDTTSAATAEGQQQQHLDTVADAASAEQFAQQLSGSYTCLQVPNVGTEGFDPSPRNSWPRVGCFGQATSPASYDEDAAGAGCGELSASWHDHLAEGQGPLGLTAGTRNPVRPSHAGMVVASKIGPDDLWKLEFPQSLDIPSKTPSFDRGSRKSVNNSTHDVRQAERGQVGGGKDNGHTPHANHKDTMTTTTTTMTTTTSTTTTTASGQKESRSRQNSGSVSNAQPTVSVRKQPTLSRAGNVQGSSDDWEVKMLVEQFDEKMKRRALEGRRHSSCDIQSWDRLVLQAEPSSSCSSLALRESGAISEVARDIAAGNSQQTADNVRRRYGRGSRVLLSRVAGVCTEVGTSRRAEIRRASLARFASVDVPSLTARRQFPSDGHCLPSLANSSHVHADSMDPALTCSELNLTSPPRQPALNQGLSQPANAICEGGSRTILSPQTPQQQQQHQQQTHQLSGSAGHDARVATFRRRAYWQSRFSSMATGEPTSERVVDNASPTSTMSAPSRPRPPQWKSLDEDATRTRRSSTLSDTDLRGESVRGSTDSLDESLPQSESANDSPLWSPPHPPAQAIGLPTIKEGLRLVDQKSEMSDDEEDDSSSTKTTLYIDIDPASPDGIPENTVSPSACRGASDSSHVTAETVGRDSVSIAVDTTATFPRPGSHTASGSQEAESRIRPAATSHDGGSGPPSSGFSRA